MERWIRRSGRAQDYDLYMTRLGLARRLIDIVSFAT